MLSRVFLKDIMSARNHRFLANSLFSFMDEMLTPESISVFYEPKLNQSDEPLFKTGDPTPLRNYPDTFWNWIAQFDTSDGMVSLAMNPCKWDYQKTMGAHCYIFMLDNHPEKRTYIVLERVDGVKLQQANEDNSIDMMQLIASRWQCVRAETEAAREYKNRDIKEAQHLDVIKQRERFIENIKLVQQAAIEISNPENLDELHKMAVEAVRDKLGFDRAGFLLLDIKKRCFNGTYGTGEQGQTVSEHHTQFDLHQLEESYINALFEGKENFVVIDNAPLYTAGQVVGQGWNGMLILRDGQETIGWIAMDNYINRKEITTYQKQMLESFGSLLSQIYIRKRQEQNVRMLHASMVELSRCMTVRDVCKCAVSFAINRLGIDRLAVFLTDKNCSYMQGTWGTDIQGNVVDESYYRSETTDRTIVNLARATPNEVAFEESVPIYHDFHIVGFGWTAMTMLTNSNGEPIAFIAADNLIKRTPLTQQLRDVIKMFASNVTEVLLRTRAQEDIQLLNENLEQQVRSRTADLQKANEKLEIMAKMDPLTRLGNRRMLESMLEELCVESKNEPASFGLVLVDIDHFGLYNNHYGHMQGDIALMRIGNILLHHSKHENEVFCRIGGEEFALLVVNKTKQEVGEIAECIRQCIEREAIPHKPSDTSDSLTVSVGYSLVTIDQTSLTLTSFTSAPTKPFIKQNIRDETQ